MADRHAIDQLLAEYAWANDTEDMQLLERLFSQEATYTIEIAGSVAVGPLRGRAEMLTFVRGATQGQTGQRRHVATNLRLTGEDGFAAYLTIFLTEDGETTVVATGIYDGRVDTAADGSVTLAALTIRLDRAF